MFWFDMEVGSILLRNASLMKRVKYAVQHIVEGRELEVIYSVSSYLDFHVPHHHLVIVILLN
jgi:hypothetical protein